MTRLGLIARSDNSGVGNQTYEVFRHLHPDRTLVIRMDAVGLTRGEEHLERYLDGPDDSIRVAQFPITDDDALWLIRESDVIYTAEATYHPGFNRACFEHGTRLVVHANPELYQPDYGEPPAEVVSATAWRADLLPGSTRMLPFPVATDRIRRREITEVRTLLHVSAPAMLDRNGTEIVHMAKPLVTRFDWLPPRQTEGYWQLYEGADALILPRRYAGLCLTMQEAAAAGLPIVMLESDANAQHTIPELRVQVDGWEAHRMKGGMVDVYNAAPEDLARVVGRLSESDIVGRATRASLVWADSISWEAQLPRWRNFLRLDAEVAA